MYSLVKSFLPFLFLILAATFSVAQDGMDKNEKMNAWMEYMTPGEVHENMAKAVGEWKTISRWWMDPAGEPMESEGTAIIEMILGDRYQKMTQTGDVMGMPMEGINLIGYDNVTQEFTSVWIDNMGTGVAIAKGKYDAETQSVIMNGSMIDPMTKKEVDYKTVFREIDEDHQIFEMFMDYDGQEFKSMEVESFRK